VRRLVRSAAVIHLEDTRALSSQEQLEGLVCRSANRRGRRLFDATMRILTALHHAGGTNTLNRPRNSNGVLFTVDFYGVHVLVLIVRFDAHVRSVHDDRSA